ncbi:MAG: hypothetical protein WCL02_06005 [bacterium]
MATYSPNSQDFIPNSENNKKINNPWWIKLCPHIVIISSLLNIFVKGFQIIEILFISLWIFYGYGIQKNKIYAGGFIGSLLIAMVIINVPEIYKNIHILMAMDIYARYPIIKDIMHWFTVSL